MLDAKSWAKSYFKRLNKMVEELQNNPFVENVVYHCYTGLTEKEIDTIEAELSMRLTGADSGHPYKLDGYMREFYKVSNGLNIVWSSILFESPLIKTDIKTGMDVAGFQIPNERFGLCEGFGAIVPLEFIANHSKISIMENPQSPVAEKLKSEGKFLSYLDYYNKENYLCISISPTDPAQNLLHYGGEEIPDYKSDLVADFVMYMEYQLSSYFSANHKELTLFDLESLQSFYRVYDYEGIEKQFSYVDQPIVDELIISAAILEEKLKDYGSFEYLRSKSDETYTDIEKLLGVELTEVFDIRDETTESSKIKEQSYNPKSGSLPIYDPKTWAQSYFERMNDVLDQLQQHQLIDHVVVHRYKGLTDEEIEVIEAELLVEIGDGEHAYKFDSYMKEFYKISNGLHLAWNSHLFQSPLTATENVFDANYEEFTVAGDDHFPCEGFLSLLPMQYFVNHFALPMYGSPGETTTAEELTSKGNYFTYFDFYNSYNDICIAFSPADPSENRLYRGTSHSASYDADTTSDFVIYMEYILATFFSVTLRSGAFLSKDDLEDYHANQYQNLAFQINKANSCKTIDDLIKYDAIEEEMLEKCGSLDYLSEKPKEIYEAIESLLDVRLENEI